MRDYAELVKALRYYGAFEQHAKEAADAIEELLAAFCMLCGICTSPPNAETFKSCEIARRCLPEPPKEVQDG